MGQYVIIIDLFFHGTLHMWARIDAVVEIGTGPTDRDR